MLSTRLPGKVLKKINNKTFLEMVYLRLKQAKKIGKIVIATSEKKADDEIENFCKEKGIDFFRGSEENVLERFYQAAKKFNFETIVRVTGDCPLIDPETADLIIQKHFESKADYTSNVFERSFPRGLDVEVFSFNALEKARNLAAKTDETEHVTSFIYSHPELFRLQSVKAPNEKKRPDIRLCLDTKEDLAVFEKIFEKFDFEKAGIAEIIQWLDKHPKIRDLNSKIEKIQRKKSSLLGQKTDGKAAKKPNDSKVAIICDCGKKSGLGHIRRCLAIAKELQKRKIEIVFIIPKHENSKKAIERQGFIAKFAETKNAKKLIEKIKENNIQKTIIDSYIISEGVLKKLKEGINSLKILKITDYPAKKSFADFLLNGNAYAKKENYPEKSKVFLGLKYFLRNPEFGAVKKCNGSVSKIPKTVLCFGGSDLNNLTLKTLTALEEKIQNALEITVICGPNYSFCRELEKFAENSKNKILILKNPANMAKVFEGKEVSVVGSSITAYESISMGLPSIAIAQVPNQKMVAKGLRGKNLAIALDKFSKKSFETAFKKILSDKMFRKKLSTNGKAEIDGFGAKRVCSKIIKSWWKN